MVAFVHRLFNLAYSIVALLFFLAALLLIGFGANELWRAVTIPANAIIRDRFDSVLEAIGLLTIAVAALELGQTIIEEEVQRVAQMSAPTWVRRFLSRFMIVVVVSLSVESLVAVFQLNHEDPAKLPYAAAIAFAAAALLAAWGVFIKLNRSAEELEPESLRERKREDARVKEEA